MPHTTKVRMVLMSHLSDVHETFANEFVGAIKKKELGHKINFVKFLMLKYSNIETRIDADEEYRLFTEKHPNL